MKFLFAIITVFSSYAKGQGLAPLEHEDGAPIKFGTWWDRLNGETPSGIDKRFGRNLSLFQSDVNMTATLQSRSVDDIFKQIEDTNTTAAVYLTVYPMEGFDAVSDAAIETLAYKIKKLNDEGVQLFLRYASEMNGAWFYYGQQPSAFKRSWIRVVSKIRSIASPDNVAFIWAPNSQNGYPYAKSIFSNTPSSPQWDPVLDTNNDGVYDELDDPFTPYYPGDEWVDWVGMSMYHYGSQFPWIDNALPRPGQAESIMIGTDENSNFNFYEMFCGSGFGGKPISLSKGKKPMIITESAATIHVQGIVIRPPNSPNFIPENQDPEFRALVKSTWWRQIINETFLRQYPKIKAISFFEFFKFEETTWRDFTMFGGYGNLSSPNRNDSRAMNGATLRILQSDMNGNLGRLIEWAEVRAPITGSGTGVVGSKPNATLPRSSAFSPPCYVMIPLLFLLT